MKLTFIKILAALATAALFMVSTAHAAITTTGYVSPSDPSTWSIDDETYAYIGNTDEAGSVTITADSTIEGYRTYLGYEAGSTGVLTVDGEDASFTNDYRLYLGYNGTGTLNITNGGSVETGSSTFYLGVYSGSSGNLNITNGGSLEAKYLTIGYQSGTSGTINVDGEGSSFTAGGGSFGSKGIGTVNVTNGASLTTTSYIIISEYSDASGSTVNIDGSTWNASSTVYVGYQGSGTLNITNDALVTTGGLTVYNGAAVVDGSTVNTSGSVEVSGWNGQALLSLSNGATVNGGSLTIEGSGGEGQVIVDGDGSRMNLIGDIEMGEDGTGSLMVSNGGQVYGMSLTASQTVATQGMAETSFINVNGEDSILEVDQAISLGDSDDPYLTSDAYLTVTGGGTVSARALTIGGDTVVTVDTDSSLELKSNGAIDNAGTVRLVAGAGADSGSHTPLSYGTMAGDGDVQALGGIWNVEDHTITVAEAAVNQAGSSSVTFDLSQTQRALITDSSGVAAGAAFLGTGDSTTITFTATAPGSEALSSLESLLTDEEEEIFSAWAFSTENYDVDEDNPVYLSLFAGSVDTILDLTIWVLEGNVWTEYDAVDLGYDGTYASFTITELGTFAVTGISSSVPVPGTLCLLGFGLMGIAGLRRRAKA